MTRLSTKKLVLVLAVLLIIAGVGFGFTRWPTLQDDQPVPQADPDGELASADRTTEDERTVELPSPRRSEPPELDTSDWKTYRNDEFWFEFRYPQYLKIGRTLLPGGPFDPGLEGSIVTTFSDGQTAELVVSISQRSLDGYIVHNNPGGEYYRFDQKTGHWMYMDTDITVEEPRLLDTSITAYGYKSGDVVGLWYGAVISDPLDNYVLELVLVKILGEEQRPKTLSHNIRDDITRVVNTLRFPQPGS